jgi:hypothetical protein
LFVFPALVLGGCCFYFIVLVTLGCIFSPLS